MKSGHIAASAAMILLASAGWGGDAPRNAPLPHPSSSAVVVTQCNLIEAVYLTMPDGKLLRFSTNQLKKIPAEDLVGFVYTRAKVSERIETDYRGAAGLPRFEKHSRNDI